MKPVESLRRRLCRASTTAFVAAVAIAGPAPPAAAQQPSQQTAAAPAGPVDGGIIDRVLVRVSGEAILYSEFEARVRDQLNLIAGQIPQAQIDAQLPMIRMGIMQAMVDEVMLEQRAEELGIRADPNQVDRAIMRIREDNNLLDDNAWSQALAQNGFTEATIREQTASSLVTQQMMFQEISRQVFVGRREIERYYEENIDQFTEPEQILFQQLIFTFAGADRAPIRERAENALTELRAGVSLTAAGNKYAADVVQDAATTSWLSPEDVRPEIAAALEALTPLSYSEVIEGPFGYHIIQLMDRKEGSTPPLEEVYTGIENLLTNQKMSAKLEEYTGDLIETAGLEIYADEFADLRTMWEQESSGGSTGPSR